MTKEFRYRPPIKYLILGLSFLGISILFFLAMNKDEITTSIIVGFLGLLTLVGGSIFTALFLTKMNSAPLRIHDDSIEIPGRWKRRESLRFDEITSIDELDTYDHIIEIYMEDQAYLIEKGWMKNADFEVVRSFLHQKLQ